jgi:hypothetical protein
MATERAGLDGAQLTLRISSATGATGKVTVRRERTSGHAATAATGSSPLPGLTRDDPSAVASGHSARTTGSKHPSILSRHENIGAVLVEDGVAVNVETLVAKEDWDAEGEIECDTDGDALNDNRAVKLSELVAADDEDSDGETDLETVGVEQKEARELTLGELDKVNERLARGDTLVEPDKVNVRLARGDTLVEPDKVNVRLARGVRLGELEYVGEILNDGVDDKLLEGESEALTETVEEYIGEDEAVAEAVEELVAVQEKAGAPRPAVGHAERHGHAIGAMCPSGQ